MKRVEVFILLGSVLLFFLAGCQSQINRRRAGYSMGQIEQRLDDFAETRITYDHSLLDAEQTQVLNNLYLAAVEMDSLFLDQVYSKNEEIKAELHSTHTDKAHLTLELFNIMFGPFDRLNDNQPFYGNQPKPPGANYYPENMTKEEFNGWIKTHPEDRAAFTSEYTMIRRKDGNLVAIPYSEYFHQRLAKAADYLREAARFSDNPSLKHFLLTRADAFLSNDYYESNMAWMDVQNNTLGVVIGPYEVYEDQLFNYKAAFESFLTIRDPQESAKVARFASYLEDMEQNLPIPDQYKNFTRGSESPMVVAHEVFTAGDTKAGVQTIAFNLPNDERVRQAKGSKKVILKNICEAKFNELLKPIASKVMEPAQLEDVTFEAFFNHTLMHEISHGLGPGIIMVDGRKTEVRQELKETYSTIEECKADVLGMYNNIFMIQKGEFPESFRKQIWNTFLAGIFRSVRFGVNEAHGAGNAIIYNFLLEKGGYEYDRNSQTVRVNYDNIYDSVRELARLLLTIQAQGDYDAARDLINSYGSMTETMKALTAKLEGIPIDIKPVYQYQEQRMGAEEGETQSSF